ncbi:hypothetical protein A9485_02205 [Bacillus cereus]|uniref:hypothetical protein n=1 Tax=Bacillus cereus group TaxID=86661 RepID=UPI0008FE34E1|nr:hypothetical protein [Bacillus cereus]OJD89909.1 hypothetical protein A9485_02205 [Bacillus cereus]
MPKIKDIVRITINPLDSMKAADVKKVGARIAEGFAAGIEKASKDTKFFGHEIHVDAAVKSERYIRAQKMRENLEKLSNMEYSGSDIEINSDSMDMVRYSFMNSEGEI